jgi:predicted nucleic acid-binding protein
MGRFTEKIRLYSIVGLDTALFIYHFEGNPHYLPLTREILSSIEGGERKGVTSTITLMEIIVKPYTLHQADIARKYETMLVNFPNLEIVDLDRDVIRQAARLRAEFHIRPPDALQVAASLLYGAEAFITNDIRLKRLQEKLDVIILDDFDQDE